MCIKLLGTPASFKRLGDAIYIGLKLEVAVYSCWSISANTVGSSGARPSVQPVTLDTEVAVELPDTLPR